MTRLEVIALLNRRGFVAKASFPSLFYHPDKPGIRYRVSDRGLRREHRLSFGEWMRVTSGYFKNLALLDGDKLSGMSRKGM
jgi:hypothetical protein